MTHDPMSLSTTWSDVAEGYVAWTMELLAPFSADAIAALDLDARAQALDVACGPGTLSLQLAPHVASIDALDFSEAMLEHLQHRLDARDDIDNVEPRQGDGQALPYDDERYDAAFSMFGLIFFPDRPAALRELHRVLKPGAQLALGAWTPVAESPGMGLFHDIFAGIFDTEADEAGEELELETLLGEVRQAGFADVRSLRVSHDMVIEEHETFWREMREGSAPLVYMREHMGDAWPAIEQQAKANFIRLVGHELPARYAMPAHLVLGRRP